MIGGYVERQPRRVAALDLASSSLRLRRSGCFAFGNAHVPPMQSSHVALAKAGLQFTARASSACARAYSLGADRPWSEDELTKARQWYNGFARSPVEAIPRTLGEVSYSRSSGPGGQNVNKCV